MRRNGTSREMLWHRTSGSSSGGGFAGCVCVCALGLVDGRWPSAVRITNIVSIGMNVIFIQTNLALPLGDDGEWRGRGGQAHLPHGHQQQVRVRSIYILAVFCCWCARWVGGVGHCVCVAVWVWVLEMLWSCLRRYAEATRGTTATVENKRQQQQRNHLNRYPLKVVQLWRCGCAESAGRRSCAIPTGLTLGNYALFSRPHVRKC